MTDPDPATLTEAIEELEETRADLQEQVEHYRAKALSLEHEVNSLRLQVQIQKHLIDGYQRLDEARVSIDRFEAEVRGDT